MQHITMVFALSLSLVASAAGAQQDKQMFNDFPPSLRQSLGVARHAAFGALSKEHRDRAELLIDEVSKGQMQSQVAASRIDAFLTSAEVSAVLAAGRTYNKALRSWLQGMPRRPTGVDKPKPDAGLTLIMLSADLGSTKPHNSS